MKLSKLILNNYRSFKGNHEFDFAPITLLFGANSVGKSSITRAIKHYDNIAKNDIFHGEKSASVELHFDDVEINVNHSYTSEMKLVDVLFREYDDEPFAFFEQFSESCHSVSINHELNLLDVVDDTKASEKTDFEVIRTTYKINNQWFFCIQDLVEFHHTYDFDQCKMAFNLDHPILQDESLKESIVKLNDAFTKLEGQARGYTNYLLSAAISNDSLDEPIYDLAQEITSKETKLRYPMRDIARLVLILRSIDNAIDSTLNINHLGPLRTIPNVLDNSLRAAPDFSDRNNHSVRTDAGEGAWKNINNSRRWDFGLRAEFLNRDKTLLDDVNEWLTDWFNTPYQVQFYDTYKLEIDGDLIRQKLESGNISKDDLTSHETKVRFLNVLNGSVTPADEIGVGISQLTPVIVHAIESRQFSVEQPELHIHPRMQTMLADLFVFEGLYEKANGDEATATTSTKSLDGSMCERNFKRKAEGKESFIVIETHSEHLMLRLLKRVREAILRPEDIAVYYIDSDHGKAITTRIGVDQEGEFTTPWPQGFFEERLEEMF